MSVLSLLRRRCDVLFVCSSIIDETWTRTTARACGERGLSVRVLVADDRGADLRGVGAFYRDIGVPIEFGRTPSEAANVRCKLMVSASSGLNRTIVPSRARLFVHMPHSLASLHMIYPPDAFDGYDVLLAAGPHHMMEFSAITNARGLDSRSSIPVGYGKLDVLAEMQALQPGPPAHVLVAPSWGQDNLLDRCGIPLAESLTREGYTVTIRPHPLFLLERPPITGAIEELTRANPLVRIESPFASDEALLTADVLIGDYSGVSFEFAALRRRPVVSVDVGLKIVNPDWRDLGLTPVEIGSRALLGPVVAPDVQAITRAVGEAISEPAGRTISDASIASFLHGRPGDCGDRAADALMDLLEAA